MAQPRSFATYRSIGGVLVALAARGGHVGQRQLDIADYLRTREPFGLRVKRFIWGGLRWSGRLVLLGPLLWLASLFAPAPISGYLVVGFVGTVVLFFTVVNLFVIASFVVWQRRLRPLQELVPPHREALPAPTAALPAPREHEAPLGVGSLLVVEGRVVPLGEPHGRGAPVIVDAWSTGDPPLRLTEAQPFAICADGQLPVILDVPEAPLVHRDHERRRIDDILPILYPETRALYDGVPRHREHPVEVEVVTLRPGDHVRVVATVTQVVDDVTRFTLDGQELGLAAEREGTPYREGERQRGLVIGPSDGRAALVYVR